MRTPSPLLSLLEIPDADDLHGTVETYRQRTLTALQTAFILAAGTGLVLFHETQVVFVSTSLSLLASVVSLLLARHGRLDRAVLLLALQLLLLPFTLAWGSLGVYDSGMLISPAGMVAIAVVARPARVALFSLLNVLAAGTVLWATLNGANGAPLPPALRANAAVDGVTAMLVLSFCGAVAVYISSIMAALLRAFARQQAQLELRVADRTAALTASNADLRQAMTTLDQARDELVRGEKLASLGSMVAGVAHELNTPIGNAAVTASALSARLEEFAARAASGELRRSDMERFIAESRDGCALLERSLQRSRDLVASFKQVAVDQTSERRRVFDLAETLDDVLSTLRPGLRGKPWELTLDVPPGIACESYPGPLDQVLINLVQNAIVHGFAGREQGRIAVRGGRGDSDTVWIEVQDDGHGIAGELHSKVFDPFFTTKLGHGGSGLGLTICHNLVTSLLGGRIEVSSRPGAGCCFRLTLPRVAPLGEATD